MRQNCTTSSTSSTSSMQFNQFRSSGFRECDCLKTKHTTWSQRLLLPTEEERRMLHVTSKNRTEQNIDGSISSRPVPSHPPQTQRRRRRVTIIQYYGLAHGQTGATHVIHAQTNKQTRTRQFQTKLYLKVVEMQSPFVWSSMMWCDMSCELSFGVCEWGL
jgi:hypothetical protein